MPVPQRINFNDEPNPVLKKKQAEEIPAEVIAPTAQTIAPVQGGYESALAGYNKSITDSGQAYAEKIKDANDALVSGIQANNTAFASNMNSLNEQYDQSANKMYSSIGEFIKQKQAEREATRQAYDEQNRKNKRTMVAGGVIDVIANAANLVGTAMGAAPMQWQSPLQGWKQEADMVRREGEQKLQRLDNEFLSLQNQLAQARYNADVKKAQMASDQYKAQAARDDAMTQASYKGAMAASEAAYKSEVNAANTGISTANAQEGYNVRRDLGALSASTRMELGELGANSRQATADRTQAKYEAEHPDMKYTSDRTSILEKGAQALGYDSFEDMDNHMNVHGGKGDRDFKARTKDNPKLLGALKRLQKGYALTPMDRDQLDALIGTAGAKEQIAGVGSASDWDKDHKK